MRIKFFDMSEDDGLFRKLCIARQVAAVATAFSLPLSTSAEAITVSIFAVLALLTLDLSRLRAVILRPAALIPVLLFLLLLIGVSWSTETPGVAIRWVGPYAKLLLIPLLIASAFTPKQVLQIGFGFLAACLILLVLSWASILWPSGPWGWFKTVGVPVKDNAVQSGCFALCAFGLAFAALKMRDRLGSRTALAMGMLALAFSVNIFFISVSKTGLLMVAALLALFIIHSGGWRRMLLLTFPSLLVIAIAIWLSAPAQRRLEGFVADMRAAKTSDESISTASRLDFWSKGLKFVQQSPVYGHGTGSIRPLYQSLEATMPSPYGEATADPHNQFLAVALQVGLLGGFLLLAMWFVHLAMFIGRDFASVMGQAVVLQNILGSLFNSHLSTVTQGMLYCLAVGLLGAIAHEKKSGFR